MSKTILSHIETQFHKAALRITRLIDHLSQDGHLPDTVLIPQDRMQEIEYRVRINRRR